MSIRSRCATWVLCVAGLLAVGPAHSQGVSDVTEPFKIFAVLWRGESAVEEGFRDYLTQRGIPFELTVRSLNFDRANAPPIVEEIRRVRPDLVYTWGTGTTSSILGKVETDTPEAFVRDIPGLFVMVAYPRVANIVTSFENPGRSATGVSFLAPIDVQLNTIRTYRPFKKIAVIYDKTAGNSRINVGELREAVPKAGMELIEMPVPLTPEGKSDPATLPGLVQEAKKRGAELLYIGPDSFFLRHGEVYTGAAIAAGLPTFSAAQGPLKSSRAAFGLVTDYYTLGKLAGSQAEKILVDKQRPIDVPVARLARYKLWINIDVVREINIYPPMDMISIADFKVSPR